MGEIFPGIKKVGYEGPNSDNPFAFKQYNESELVAGKTMKEHLRFSVAYWHTMTGQGEDPFGQGTMVRPYSELSDPMDLAKARIDACFELLEKLSIPFFCFHDRDIAPEGATLNETNKRLDEITELLQQQMRATGKKLLWGTANLFTHPRYMHGAATSCQADVFAYAAAQVKKAMEITKELDGSCYVFWGGREGYETLLNTDMALELDNLGRFFRMAVDYSQRIGFSGQFLIEPKPKEPTKHQYDFDAASVISFLKQYGLEQHFKLNIEANHATLAGHTFQHELRLARVHGMLGSVDANQGDELLGWDTDQFPTNVYGAVLAMYEILKNGGLQPGGLNFDARVRRPSYQADDLFLAHIAAMDTFAFGLKTAAKILASGEFEEHVTERYADYSKGIGAKIVAGEVGFEQLEEYVMGCDRIVNSSGRQEMLEALLNQYIWRRE